MSQRSFTIITLILVALVIASFFLPDPYGTLISTTLIIAYSAYLILLIRSNRLTFPDRIRSKIRICSFIAIFFGFVVFFAVVWQQMSHYNEPDPKGVIPTAAKLKNMQRSE